MLLRLLLVFWLWRLKAVSYIVFFLIKVIVGDVIEVFLIFFKTLEALFLLFLRDIVSILVFVGFRSWDI